MLFPIQSASPDVKFFRHSSGSNVSVEVVYDDLEEGVVFSVELLQFHIESSKLAIVVA